MDEEEVWWNIFSFLVLGGLSFSGPTLWPPGAQCTEWDTLSLNLIPSSTSNFI